MNEQSGFGRLDRMLIHGVAWTASGRWITQLFSWVATFILARLLTPEDFGVVAMASIFIGVVVLISDMGLGTAVVTFQDLSEEEIGQMHGLSMLLGVGGFVATLIAAVPIGYFFNAPNLPRVISVMGISFVISGARPVTLGLLQRDFHFKYIAAVESTQALIVAGLQVALAFAGWRYWSIVVADIGGITVATLLLLYKRRPPVALPRIQALHRVTRFTAHIVVTRLCWYAYSNADFMIVGKLRGEHDLGVYKIAWDFASAPLRKVTELVNRVTPSVFSAVKDDPAALRRYVLSISEVLALVVFPMTVGMATISGDFVHVFLGDKWAGAVLPLCILSVYMSVRAVTTVVTQILTYTGDTYFGMWIGVLSATLLPCAFLVGSHWGLVGVASAWIFAHPLALVPAYRRVLRRIELPFRRYLRSIWPAASSSALMVAGCLSLRAALPADINAKIRLAAVILTGAALYAGWMLLWHRRRLRSIYAVIRASATKSNLTTA